MQIRELGWDKPERNGGCKGISIISPTHPKAKNYYAIDYLAFRIWKRNGVNSFDPDYIAWLNKKPAR